MPLKMPLEKSVNEGGDRVGQDNPLKASSAGEEHVGDVDQTYG